MAKTTSPAAGTILKDIRSALDERVDEKVRVAPARRAP